MATVDLDWSALDEHLATSLVNLLNRQLTSTRRPSFIGPLSVLGFEFGAAAPEVEIVDIRDIHPDFLEDDNADETLKSTEPTPDFEGMGDQLEPRYEYERAGDREVFRDTHSHGMRSSWNPQSSFGPIGDSLGPIAGTGDEQDEHSFLKGHRDSSSSLPPFSELQPGVGSSLPPLPEPSGSNHPDLQLHFHIEYHSNLRLTLSTSLLINYPSQQFMSLPVKLSITGIIFTGEVVVAYEGSRRKIHLSVLDDQDPHGLPTRSSSSPHPETEPNPHPSKPLPVGQRLLPNIFIESEIGQADKHMLKNVSRVERFVEDVIRKTVEDELVYPNFITVELPKPS
ncbi:Mitochondrial distribution and morphology protein 12 [Tulasnella sp. 418]|nr:Mitochondrial distribution and morphology protein 12 [Tulasnella sp. 418]